MATIDELTEAAIARLKERIGSCQVEAYPDNANTYQFIHPMAALLVRYAGSRYPENGIEATDLVVQERYPIVEVSILTRTLNGPNGAGAFMDAVRTALTGWKPPDCGRAYVVDEDFDKFDRQKVTWQHHLTFEARAMWIESADTEDEEPPLLQRITYQSPDNPGRSMEVP